MTRKYLIAGALFISLLVCGVFGVRAVRAYQSIMVRVHQVEAVMARINAMESKIEGIKTRLDRLKPWRELELEERQ